MYRSENVKNVTKNDLSDVGFEPYWKPVDKLIGTLSWGEGEQLLLVKSTSWDGATEGRLETILKCTDFQNLRRVWSFFSRANPLDPLIGECLSCEAPLMQQGPRMALLSRYRDNIYICLVNVSPEDLPMVKVFLSSFLKTVYRLPLKWENHTELVTWGEACVNATSDPLSLPRKGCALRLDDSCSFEWDSWVSLNSTNAKPVWRSHFTALLHKSLWYALSPHDIRLNLRSLMWGIGARRYPSFWWIGTLRRFHGRFNVQRVVSIKQLLIWKVEGKNWFTSLGKA